MKGFENAIMLDAVGSVCTEAIHMPSRLRLVMQALGNTVAAIALTDSVMAELCVSRAPHMLPLAASALQVRPFVPRSTSQNSMDS